MIEGAGGNTAPELYPGAFQNRLGFNNLDDFSVFRSHDVSYFEFDTGYWILDTR